ncbi:MAG TPA: GIY-YIG nuclease family protein [Chloroflexi bacterium]|nr:GIY-YIG nuclease family protein [Chloroflexota bacterium]HPO57752.1 GIY-YIG nuclease family protein [Anaerolineaceae bacterium]
MLEAIPAAPGTYVLAGRLSRPVELPVGRLGMAAFQPGVLLYAGSALGPGGLKARLRHHLEGSSRPHWHLDYLRPWVRWEAAWWHAGPERLECRWLQALARSGDGWTFPVRGFGASDCTGGCPAHLLWTPEKLTWDGLHRAVLQAAQACQFVPGRAAG